MIETVKEHSTQVSFRIVHIQSLQPDFAKTFDLRAAGSPDKQEQSYRDRVRRRDNEVPDLLRQGIPDGLHRRQLVHPREAEVMVARHINTSYKTDLGTCVRQ